jgi:hypothetical protein
MVNSIKLLLNLVLLFFLCGCPAKKEEFPEIVPIGFLPAVTITPTARTMQRGDTLWLEANFSDSLADKNSGLRYRIRPEDVALTSYIIYHQLVGKDKQPVGIASSFRIVEKVGKAPIGGSTSGLLLPVYDGSYYRAKIGLIPTRAGITAISLRMNPAGGTRDLGKFIPAIQLPPDSQGREQKAVLDDSFYVVNEGKANNFDLFSQHTRAFSLEPGEHAGQDLYEQQSTFTVEVK